MDKERRVGIVRHTSLFFSPPCVFLPLCVSAPFHPPPPLTVIPIENHAMLTRLVPSSVV